MVDTISFYGVRVLNTNYKDWNEYASLDINIQTESEYTKEVSRCQITLFSNNKELLKNFNKQ